MRLDLLAQVGLVKTAVRMMSDPAAFAPLEKRHQQFIDRGLAELQALDNAAKHGPLSDDELVRQQAVRAAVAERSAMIDRQRAKIEALPFVQQGKPVPEWKAPSFWQATKNRLSGNSDLNVNPKPPVYRQEDITRLVGGSPASKPGMLASLGNKAKWLGGAAALAGLGYGAYKLLGPKDPPPPSDARNLYGY